MMVHGRERLRGSEEPGEHSCSEKSDIMSYREDEGESWSPVMVACANEVSMDGGACGGASGRGWSLSCTTRWRGSSGEQEDEATPTAQHRPYWMATGLHPYLAPWNRTAWSGNTPY